jgi:hypothetical protein
MQDYNSPQLEVVRGLEKVSHQIGELANRLTSIESGQKGFWAREWPDVIRELQRNSTKIIEIEMELARLKTKIAISGAVVVFILTSAVTISTAYIGQKSERKERLLYDLLEEIKGDQNEHRLHNPKNIK